MATFDESGNLLKTLVQGGNLDDPWGVAIAPADGRGKAWFGTRWRQRELTLSLSSRDLDG